MNPVTQDTLRAFRPQHGYFVGFDSDGCVFDSMELKHKECFIPNIIKSYALQPVSKYAREAAEFVNLYSVWRGINRFPGLVKTIELLRERSEVQRRGVALPDLSALQRFIEGARALGNPALEEAVNATGDPELVRALSWSKAVNRDIDAMVKGLPPFPLVAETLALLRGRADAMVVSATPADALRREWAEHGIDRLVDVIAGQEIGKKEEQLGLTAQGKYPSGCVLMVGDALGDFKAAKAVGASFYPVVPGREEESWSTFHGKIVGMFLEGRYTPDVQARYVAEFERALPATPPWAR
jgi:phosphoglycolate phosphatase-like HAD superfamily hydrolase